MIFDFGFISENIYAIGPYSRVILNKPLGKIAGVLNKWKSNNKGKSPENQGFSDFIFYMTTFFYVDTINIHILLSLWGISV